MDKIVVYEEQQQTGTNSSPTSYSDVDAQERALSRDEDFYRDTGDTIILVEQTLFKIHRAYLTEPEESTLRDLFLVPNNIDVATEGTDDQHPIVFFGDSPEEFKTLLRVLYTPPWTVLDPSAKNLHMDVEDLYYLASIATKYAYKGLSKWAMDRLVKRCFIHTGDNSIIDGWRVSRPAGYAATCSEDFLEKLLFMSVNLYDDELQTKIENCWISRLKLSPYLSIGRALRAGETLGLDKFLGKVYYVAVVKTARQTRTINEYTCTAQLQPSYSSGLTPEQQLTVIKGIAQLSLLWDATSLRYISGIDQIGTFRTTVQSSPETILTQIPSSDVLGKLECLLFAEGPWTCIIFDVAEIRNVHEYHSQNLHLHFFDYPPGEADQPGTPSTTLD